MSRYSEGFYCPITGDLMVDPVMDREGNSYERIAIIEWLTRSDTSPITRNPLSQNDLIPNRQLRNSIQEAIEAEKKALSAIQSKPSSSSSSSSDCGGGYCPNNGGIGSAVHASLSLSPIESTDHLDHYLVHGSIGYTTTERVPSDIVVVIDTSGSMNDPANTATNEHSGLTILDIVKHAVKTIKTVMNEFDRLAIVSFSDRANLDMPLTRMDERGKNEVDRNLRLLVPHGTTNLWDGLKTGLDVLKAHNAKPEEASLNNSFIILLTDGAPNIEPPRGHLPMLKKYQDACIGGKLPGTICTFGFGYSLDSVLLRDLATFGGGMYSFIPDSGLMGTAFINAMSNIMVSSVRDVKINLDGGNEVQFVNDPTLNETSHTRVASSLQIFRSAIQSDQSFDFVKHIAVPRGRFGDLVSMKVEYVVVGQPAGALSRKTQVVASNLNMPADNWELQANIWRTRTVQLLLDLQKLLKNNFEDNKSEANRRIRELSTNLRTWLTQNSHRVGDFSNVVQRLEDLLDDIDGQISEACSKAEYYQKWGKHYLPSLCKAHDLQQSNNFKDPGIQHYGGELFNSIRDVADDLYTSLPAPKPTHISMPIASSAPPVVNNTTTFHMPAASNSRTAAPVVSSSYGGPSGGPHSPIVNMQSYHDRSAGCFHGDCEVTLSNGMKIPARMLVRGMKLKDGSTVVAVMKTICLNGESDLVILPGGLMVTPFHPVFVNGKWTFPSDLASPTKIACDSIYSFLLMNESGKYSSSINVCGVDCITLCHGVQNDPVASHAYFGSLRVVEDLMQSRGFYAPEGIVTLDQAYPLGTMMRNRKTHLVCGIVISDKISSSEIKSTNEIVNICSEPIPLTSY